MRVDESELRSRFSSMPEAQFAFLRRSELTPEGQRAYDEEADWRAVQREATPRCPKCESETMAGANFCSACGHSFTGLAPAKGPAPSMITSTQPITATTLADSSQARLDSSPKFWLTWKEFLAVMVLLAAFSSLVAAGGSGDDTYNASSVAGTAGGIYVVVFIIRKLRVRD